MFKTSMTGLLLAMISLSSPAQAQAYQATPFELSFLTYRGYLANFGIPGNAEFCSKFKMRRISVQDVMEAAALDNRIALETLDDEEYRSALSMMLHSRCRRR